MTSGGIGKRGIVVGLALGIAGITGLGLFGAPGGPTAGILPSAIGKDEMGGHQSSLSSGIYGNRSGKFMQEDLAAAYPSAAPSFVSESPEQVEAWNTEGYDPISENAFCDVTLHPVSTFSIDVDRASYANVRRFLSDGYLPPKDAVRIEEMINYFHYDYDAPSGGDPFAIHTELADCPWNPDHLLVHVGLQGRRMSESDLPPSNLVFLVDVSGSMSSAEKLPLLKEAFRLLVDQLKEDDRVAIVVYAGSSGLVLPSISGAAKDQILAAIDELTPGGSTAGAAGIKLAYDIAIKNFRKGGNNRVILATDGDFNVGVSSDGELVELIEEKRRSGVHLTVLGFGTGNYQDAKMEKLADRGNGNYAYVDSLNEARKVLITELGGTLHTIAKDVKIQIEFNPAHVKAYRLIGYENRLLAREDFDDDSQDAGELGAGHTVTALYEIIPASSAETVRGARPLRYQSVEVTPRAHETGELMSLALRYKRPAEDESNLLTQVVMIDTKRVETSDDFRFAAAVAEFGMLLRQSPWKGNSTWKSVRELANSARGPDDGGYRGEFVRLVDAAERLEG